MIGHRIALHCKMRRESGGLARPADPGLPLIVQIRIPELAC
jgi:hypothetical protein